MMADFDKLRDFAAAFDGHVFRGKDGTPFSDQTTPKEIQIAEIVSRIGSEYQAVVEYAPSQKIPSQKSKPRVDARQGQIDKGVTLLPSTVARG